MMQNLVELDRGELSRRLEAIGADLWLLFDFKGMNPVAGRLLGLTGLGSRRLFVALPSGGEFAALAHRIELQPLEGFPGSITPYSRWEELHEGLGRIVRGRTVAMEISPSNRVPYLDRVPWGVVRLIEEFGGKVVSSAELVTTFTARWSSEEAQGHRRAAETLATIAREEIAAAVAGIGSGLTESAMQRRVLERIAGEGLVIDHPPIVAFGANAANPHYEPVAGRDASLQPGQLVLLDLFAGPGVGMVQADQTWMGYTGKQPDARSLLLWETVRDARDAALDLIATSYQAGRTLRGYEVDQVCRDAIAGAGFADYFVHRTGHSIDRDLHGSGPHLDNYETRDERELIPGVGFSVEPGIYLPGEAGVRSEVNVYLSPNGPEVTPSRIQRDLIVP